MNWNPNGESSCAASHQASDKRYPPAGLLGWLLSASPMRDTGRI